VENHNKYVGKLKDPSRLGSWSYLVEDVNWFEVLPLRSYISAWPFNWFGLCVDDDTTVARMLEKEFEFFKRRFVYLICLGGCLCFIHDQFIIA